MCPQAITLKQDSWIKEIKEGAGARHKIDLYARDVYALLKVSFSFQKAIASHTCRVGSLSGCKINYAKSEMLSAGVFQLLQLEKKLLKKNY